MHYMPVFWNTWWQSPLPPHLLNCTGFSSVSLGLSIMTLSWKRGTDSPTSSLSFICLNFPFSVSGCTSSFLPSSKPCLELAYWISFFPVADRFNSRLLKIRHWSQINEIRLSQRNHLQRNNQFMWLFVVALFLSGSWAKDKVRLYRMFATWRQMGVS